MLYIYHIIIIVINVNVDYHQKSLDSLLIFLVLSSAEH